MVDNEMYVFIIIEATFGGAVFVTNVCLLCCISRLLCTGHSKRDKYGIVIHSFFVCVSDTLSGLTLFLAGLFRVDSYESAFVCTNLGFFSLTTQIISQANIACICVQRYILSRGLRRTHTNWSKSYTKSLLVVNLIIGVASLASFFAGMKIKYLPDKTVACTLGNVVQGESAFVVSATAIIGIMCIFVGDIFCFLNIRKLRMSVSNLEAAPSDTSGRVHAQHINLNNCPVQSGQSAVHSIRTRQKKATITLLLILICFNLSSLPGIIGFILLRFGVKLTFVIRRIVWLSLFVNSMANPLIIATRVEEINHTIRKTAFDAWSRTKEFFSR